jgi:hypothetical protein
MASYSYIYSDYDANPNGKASITENDTVKILIPQKFGGGFIKAKYVDYGRFELESGKLLSDCYIGALWNNEDFTKILKEKFGFKNAFEGLDNEEQLSEIWEDGIDYVGDVDGAIAEFPVKIIKETSNMTYEECCFHIIGDPEQGGNYKFEYLKTYPGFFGSYLKYMEYLKEVADEIKTLKKRDYFVEDRIKLETENKYLLNYMREISKKEPADYKKMENILKLINFNNEKLQNIFNGIEANMIRTIEDGMKNILETEIPEKTRNQLLKVQEDISMLIKGKYGRQINDLRTSMAKMILIRTEELNEIPMN